MFKKTQLSQNSNHSVGRFYQVRRNSLGGEKKKILFLLGIKSPYRATRRYVDQANCDIYKRLHSTLTICRIIQNTTPISQQFLSMYLLDSHAVKLPIISMVNKSCEKNFFFGYLFREQKEYESFLSIANFICSFLDNDNEQRLDINAESWFMTCKIYDKFIQLTRRIALLVRKLN